MVLNFGFQTLEDGTRECYHAGEYFHGNVPILSQVMLLIFKVHARWVVWSTEHHVNHYAFSASTDEEEEMEEQSRANMPRFLLKVRNERVSYRKRVHVLYKLLTNFFLSYNFLELCLE